MDSLLAQAIAGNEQNRAWLDDQLKEEARMERIMAALSASPEQMIEIFLKDVNLLRTVQLMANMSFSESMMRVSELLEEQARTSEEQTRASEDKCTRLHEMVLKELKLNVGAICEYRSPIDALNARNGDRVIIREIRNPNLAELRATIKVDALDNAKWADWVRLEELRVV